MKRVFLVVCDSLGVGFLPDAYKWGDEGSNTLATIRKSPLFYCPTLEKLGLFNIDGVGGGIENPLGAFGKAKEVSVGKDTTTGHWELAGLTSKTPFPTYPNGFPEEIIEEFSAQCGRGVLCNKPYSGMDVIRDFGEEHCKTGKLIVYTSADSVFQIAAHEKIVPLEDLYSYCRIARNILQGENAVGRVIARPFVGKYPFERTSNRHDFSLIPPKDTMLDLLKATGHEVISVGKIFDIFTGKGITESHLTTDNSHGMRVLSEIVKRTFDGLCFVNLVDFDMKYGHRNDIDGYANALSVFDEELAKLLLLLQKDDLLIVTADHGCDPGTKSTDHSREYIPILLVGEWVKKGTNLGARPTFADVSATVLDYFGIEKGETDGESFLSLIR